MPRACRPITVVERPNCACEVPAHFHYDMTVDAATGLRPVPYDIFLHPDYLVMWAHGLSPRYFKENAHRPPITVVLPSGDWFTVDVYPSDDKQGGWAVTGEFPLITVSPSINIRGRWHGYLTKGELGDDVEGRVFP